MVLVGEDFAGDQEVWVGPEIRCHCHGVGHHVGGWIFSFLALGLNPSCWRKLRDEWAAPVGVSCSPIDM